jgi:hypothetical protein
LLYGDLYFNFLAFAGAREKMKYILVYKHHRNARP